MKLLRTGALSALVLLASAAPPAASQLIPLGPEFRVNEAEVQALEAPALALGTSGRLLAVWPGPGSEANDLLVRLFERGGDPAGPVTVIPGEGNRSLEPEAVTLPSGRFAVAWEDWSDRPYPAYDLSRLYLHVLDADGALVGGRTPIEEWDGGGTGARIAARPSGGVIATWDPGGVAWRFFDADGHPEGGLIGALSSMFPPYPLVHNDAVVALDDGSFLLFWYTEPRGESGPLSHWALRLDAAGRSEGNPVFSVPNGPVAVGGDGHFAVAWSGQFPGVPPGSGLDARLSLYDPDGHPSKTGLVVADGEGDQVVQAIARDEDGRILVVWSNANETLRNDASIDADLSARLFAVDGTPLGPAFPVAADTAGDQLGARAIARDGDWVISWVTETSTSGGGNLFARRFTTCDGPTLCLGDRFRAEVAWRVSASGAAGSGQAVPLTGDTGAFWFFGPENLELVVKVLDGRAVNGNFWVFYGALSNVEYDLTVTDVVTGEQRVYHNPAGTMASRADTRAFPGGDGAPAGAASAALAEAPRQRIAPLTPPPCFDGPENLCLGSPWLQFDVRVAWKVPGTGETGSGKAVRLTGETGYFWFFGPENVELIVKILDGRDVNGKHWVFYGALSDVEYTITVTDKLSGKVKTYHNPAGTMASRADTAAF